MTIGWIDFSNTQRQQIEAALNRLTPRGTLDQLGFGQLRDGLANLLFPGTSTLHTRSVYLMIVPKLLRDIAAKPGKRGVREIIQLLHKREAEAIGYLQANSAAENAYGIIGKAAGKSLKQKPSGAYWSAIKAYGLVDRVGSLRQFVARNLPYWRAGNAAAGFAALAEYQAPPPAGWLTEQRMQLAAEEVDFLRRQIYREHATSLFATLLRVQEEREDAVGVDIGECQQVVDLSDLPGLEQHTGLLRHCRTYEYVCRSALLSYNTALRIKTGRTYEELSAGREALYEAVATYQITPTDVSSLLATFPASDRPTARFLQHWSGRLFERTDHSRQALAEIEEREYRMKGSRANLKDLSRAEALAPGATAGMSVQNGEVQPVFSYRWPTVKGHLHDLQPLNPSVYA